MDYWTAFILGLIGSVHCAGMCGPLALALPHRSTNGTGFVLNRVAYNAGRILTYCILGIVFGALGRTLWLAGVQRWLSIVLGLVLIFGLLASGRLGLQRSLTLVVARLKSYVPVLLRRPSTASVALLGLLNGLLPCGLVYVACTGATATGGIRSGAAYMAAFGAGTVPLMLAISISGKLIPPSFRLKLYKAIPVSVFLLGTLLILRGMSLGIPYLSPDLSVPGACCHK
jgi:sulfite exporter TauE/SafE